MPGLKLQGNLIENFGEFFPTPIIEHVEVQERSFIVDVALYFNFDKGTSMDHIDHLLGKAATYNIDGTIADAKVSGILAGGTSHSTSGAGQQLQTYVFYVIGSTYAENIINKKTTNLWTEIIAAGTQGRYKGSLGSSNEEIWIDGPNYIQTPFSTYTRDPTIYYDDKNNPVIKMYTQIEMKDVFSEDLNMSLLNTNLFEQGTDTTRTNFFHSDFNGTLTLFAFSSPTAYSERGQGTAVDIPWRAQLNQDSNRRLGVVVPMLPIDLLKHQFSDVSYETILRNGVINTFSENKYFTPQGVLYNNIPYRTLDGLYRSADGFSQEECINMFETLLVEHADSENAEITNILNNIYYILETYRYTPRILKALQKYQKTYSAPTDPSTITGQFYNRYKNHILAANQKILANPILEKKQVQNIKIFDHRVASPVGWTQTILPDIDPLYMKNWQAQVTVELQHGGHDNYEKTGEGFKWDSDIMKTNTSYADTTPGRMLKYGYFFFDAEKALLQGSNIATVYDVDKLRTYFPSVVSAARTAYQVIKADLYCFQPTSTSDLYSTPATGLGGSYTDAPTDMDDKIDLVSSTTLNLTYADNYPQPTGILRYNSGFAKTSMAPPPAYNEDISPGVTDVMSTATEYSYLCNRNFEVVDRNVLYNYNLMCFEFQDVESLDGSWEGDEQAQQKLQYYSAGIEVNDKTKDIIHYITGAYAEEMPSLKGYYDLAQEHCAYAAGTEAFTEVFIAEAEAAYESVSESNKPWILAPLVYLIHQDLLYDTYAGRRDQIARYASLISAKIAPGTGAKSSLDVFWGEFEGFWNDNYATGQPFSNAVAGLADEITRNFGYNRGVDPTTPDFYSPLPDFLESGMSVAAAKELVEANQRMHAIYKIVSSSNFGQLQKILSDNLPETTDPDIIKAGVDAGVAMMDLIDSRAGLADLQYIDSMIAGIMETMSQGGISPDMMISAFGMDLASVQSMVDITEAVSGLGGLDLLNMAAMSQLNMANIQSKMF
tara:strand:+ start:11631 stop:14627 length:2997 start_codon:yes stop_codon:yes gene_type:complete